MVLWGGRAVIPQRLRARVLQELHTGHLGGSKMKHLARRYVWWPGLDGDLETMVRGCQACAEKRGAPPRTTLHPWEPTLGPWQRIHVDFAGPVENQYMMVVYDSFTKWVEAVVMTSTSAGRTVEELRELFARFGLPLQVVTDNGPQFTSAEFANFLSVNGVRHIRTAPYHPASNGAAERAVRMLKDGLRANARDGGTLHRRVQKVLMTYRTAPHAVTGRPPAEVMFGRPIRTRLDLLHPSITRDIEDSRQDQREAAGGRPRQFQVGQTVWARTYAGPRRWRRGEVIGVTGPVSYQVNVGEAVWARHANQLLPATGRDEQQPAEPVHPWPEQQQGYSSVPRQQQQQQRPVDSTIPGQRQPHQRTAECDSPGERGEGERSEAAREEPDREEEAPTHHPEANEDPTHNPETEDVGRQRSAGASPSRAPPSVSPVTPPRATRPKRTIRLPAKYR